jgi:hypothetical protein
MIEYEQAVRQEPDIWPIVWQSQSETGLSLRASKSCSSPAKKQGGAYCEHEAAQAGPQFVHVWRERFGQLLPVLVAPGMQASAGGPQHAPHRNDREAVEQDAQRVGVGGGGGVLLEEDVRLGHTER